MKKSINKITVSTLATVLASSALIPVAAQAAENQVPIHSIVLKTADGNLAKLDFETYKEALLKKFISTEDITHIISQEEKVYNFEDYKEALLKGKDLNKAFEILKENELEDKDSVILEGKFTDDGELVTEDETPEEKVNETFFYNFAA